MNIKKVRGSFWNAVFDIVKTTMIFIVLFSLVILWGLLWGVFDFSTQALAWAAIFIALVLGILEGLVMFFLVKQIKIEFELDVVENLLKMKKNHYNLLFLSWLQDPLRKLGTVSIDEYMLFVKDILFGYYRGKDAKGTGKYQNQVNKPTWDEVQLFAMGLLDHDNKYFEEACNLIGYWIRDRKREEIK